VNLVTCQRRQLRRVLQAALYQNMAVQLLDGSPLLIRLFVKVVERTWISRGTSHFSAPRRPKILRRIRVGIASTARRASIQLLLSSGHKLLRKPTVESSRGKCLSCSHERSGGLIGSSLRACTSTRDLHGRMVHLISVYHSTSCRPRPSGAFIRFTY
jgi:hypothetical protein